MPEVLPLRPYLTTMKKNLGNAAFATPYFSETETRQIGETADKRAVWQSNYGPPFTISHDAKGTRFLSECTELFIPRPLPHKTFAEIVQDSPPVTVQEAIRRGEVMRKLRAVTRTQDTLTPDAMGDRMASCMLAYVNARAGVGGRTPAEVITYAETLLQELEHATP